MVLASDMPYENMGSCMLYYLLRDPEISGALTYMVVGKVHSKLNVIPLTNSIELSNSTITISVVLSVGFEVDEFLKLKERLNYHVVSFNYMAPRMIEYKGIDIHYIDNAALLNYVIVLTKNKFGQKLRILKNLNK